MNTKKNSGSFRTRSPVVVALADLLPLGEFAQQMKLEAVNPDRLYGITAWQISEK